MKKIEFGYANDIDPKGSWEGIGIKQGLLLIEADYYGAIQYEGNSYIVAKVTEDKYGRFPDMVDKFIVRNAVVDIYADGSSTLFLNQEESLESKQFERYLNMEQLKDKVNNVSDVLNFINGVYAPNKSFRLLEMDDKIIATSITNEAFEVKNEAIKNCRQTISEMQRHIQEQTNSISR